MQQQQQAHANGLHAPRERLASSGAAPAGGILHAAGCSAWDELHGRAGPDRERVRARRGRCNSAHGMEAQGRRTSGECREPSAGRPQTKRGCARQARGWEDGGGGGCASSMHIVRGWQGGETGAGVPWASGSGSEGCCSPAEQGAANMAQFAAIVAQVACRSVPAGVAGPSDTLVSSAVCRSP